MSSQQRLQPRQCTIHVVFNLLILESHDRNPVAVDDLCSRCVMLFVVVVDLAIEFNNQSFLVTIEVGNRMSRAQQG